MRRMVKEDLLTFEGKPLFPERIAETVPYELTELEQRPLRAGHRLRPRGDEPRRQARRQAPEHGRLRAHGPPAPSGIQSRSDLPLARAPCRSARTSQAAADRRRRGRRAAGRSLCRPRARSTTTSSPPTSSRTIEEELVDAATAARTVEELDIELADLARLIEHAKRVRASETDRKWSELRTILEDEMLTPADGRAAAQADHLHRAPRHAGLPRPPDRRAARPAGGGRHDPRRRAAQRAAARSPRSSPTTRTVRSCSPPTRPARASTSRPRT